MGNFKQRAIDATTTSKLLENRTKISTEEVLAKYPEGVTVIGFDFLTGDNGKYPVCIFKENNNECFFGGTAMTEICNRWMEGYNTVDECNADLAAEGGVKLKFEKSKTKQNRNFIKISIVE